MKSSHELDEELWMKDSNDYKGSSNVEFELSFLNSLSIIKGKNAQLDCKVKNQGSHEISWYHIDKQLLLSINGNKKTSNPRIRVVSNKSSFTLYIESVELEDGGYYACRINTMPPKSQVKYLEVVVQPRFVDTSIGSETTIEVKEHENATLLCKAVASPPPVVKWSREDGRPIIRTPFTKSQDTITGDELVLTQVSRWMSGSFICSASSGISAPISRRISLLVSFPPMIMIPSQLVTIGAGYSVTLECHTESYPLARQEWIGPHGEKIVLSSKNSWKLSLTEHKAYSFKIVYKMTLYQVNQSDSGHYTCVAKNKLGMTRSSLTLQVFDDWKQSTSSPLLRRAKPETSTPNFNDDFMQPKYFSAVNVSVAEENSSEEDEKSSEVFIDLTASFRNRTNNIWAHFSTNQSSQLFHSHYTLQTFVYFLSTFTTILPLFAQNLP